GASASGFYEWLGRPPSARSLANARLLVRIRESFALSQQTYGSPRIWKDMIVAGESCSENRVARLMRKAAISAQPKPRRQPTDVGVRPEHGIAPNVLQRDFAAAAPNRKWAADFTYIWTGEGWLFVAVVVDLFSRRVVGWSMQSTMTAQLVLDALLMALWRRGKPTELLHHSDQGSQYTSEDFQRLLAAEGVTCSMSRRGDCWDNSAVESFFASLKKDRVHRTTYATREAARADIFDHVEAFYNSRRRHSTLGQVSPMEFERTHVGLA
ncbi:MAG: IS3 family transposase, partial [Terriglobales bacterium]